MRDLFGGRFSILYPGERAAFFVTLLLALPAAGLIGFFIHEEIGVSQVALFFVIAMVYVTQARGGLVGSSVRIHEAQYPKVFAIVKRCAAALDMPMPLVFVRDDYTVPFLTVGFGDPYSLIISSHWMEHFQEDELTFQIGRELGHIAAGHTRYTSLLSVNGRENAIVSIIFGAWLRKMELTCDRVGLLCCGSLDSAIRGIAIASFHAFGRNINHAAFAEQSREVNADSALRLGEWLGAVPYATRRIDAMRTFLQSELYRAHEERFLERAGAQPRALRESTGMHVTRRDCAGWWRRLGSSALDFIVVYTIVMTIFGADTNSAAHQTGLAAQLLRLASKSAPFLRWHDAGALAELAFMPIWFSLYSAMLVALAGQTPGMMITGLRVVRTDFRRPGVAQALWRYLTVCVLWPFLVILSPFSRVYLQDKLSRTRLIKTERVLARAGTSAA